MAIQPVRGMYVNHVQCHQHESRHVALGNAYPQKIGVALQAAAKAPSIVFLDELDGLVPARGASANPGTQIYASVVSTLLALLDGISDRGDVIIIGATNRCDRVAFPFPERFPAGQLCELQIFSWSALPCRHTSTRFICCWVEGPVGVYGGSVKGCA